MNSFHADCDRLPTLGVLHFYTAQRLIGFLGGAALITLIVLAMWALGRWEHAARAKNAAIPQSNQVPADQVQGNQVQGNQVASAIPPVPTFITAGLVSLPNPSPQTEETPKTDEPKRPPAKESPTPFVPRGKTEPRNVPTYGAPKGGLLANDIATFEELPVLRRVRAPRDAMVKAVQVEPGQIVKKGDLLLMLFSETLEWQMIELMGDLEMSEAKLAMLDQKRATMQRLIEKNAATQEDLLVLQMEVRVAKVELRTRKNQYDLLARAKMELNVLAPMDGMIHAENLEADLLGNPVNRGDLLLEIVSAKENKPAQ